MQITEELLAEGRSGPGGWSKAQVTILGVEWPLRKGWKARIMGREISEADAARFLRLRIERSSFDLKAMENHLDSI